MSGTCTDTLERAVHLLGPLEGRIMRAVWTNAVGQQFVVRDVQVLMPELAYTTVMTTLNRLADKGLLGVQAVRGQRAHTYSSAETPEGFLLRSSKDQVAKLVEQFGDTAVAAFAEHIETLDAEQRKRLEALARQ